MPSAIERSEKYKAQYDGEAFYLSIKHRKNKIEEKYEEKAEEQSLIDAEFEEFMNTIGTVEPHFNVYFTPEAGKLRDYYISFLHKLSTAGETEIEMLHQQFLERGLPEELWRLTIEKYQILRKREVVVGDIIIQWEVILFPFPEEEWLKEIIKELGLEITPEITFWHQKSYKRGYIKNMVGVLPFMAFQTAQIGATYEVSKPLEPEKTAVILAYPDLYNMSPPLTQWIQTATISTSFLARLSEPAKHTETVEVTSNKQTVLGSAPQKTTSINVSFETELS
jgi:hypothetical protein